MTVIDPHPPAPAGRPPDRRLPVRPAVVAALMISHFAHRTWSIAPTDRTPLCHAFFVTQGAATFRRADGGMIELGAPALLWLPCSAQGAFRLDAGGEGATCAVAEDFVRRAVGDSSALLALKPVLDRIALASAERLSGCVGELDMIFAALVREAREAQPGAAAMMEFHLGLLLLHLWRASAQTPASVARGTGMTTVQRFRQLVEIHYRETLAIDDFARLLGVTRSHLHDACLRATGRTPLTFVHDRLVEEARLRLEQTDLPVEQVGYSLGFRDAAYFSRFFKHRTGTSPGSYRKGAVIIRTEQTPPSFSAWP